jgi:endonuclease G, mitochondrial
METETILISLGSAAAGAAAQYVWMRHIWPKRHATYTWVFALRNHRSLGVPCKTDKVLDRQGYSLGYSYERRCALWVSYIISQRSISVDVERGERFYPDPEIPAPYRVHPDDFKNSGYDKGHLAPSAAIDFSRKSNDETFAMSNIALQHPKLNRQAWGRLEGMMRAWTSALGKLAVITGPVYGPKPQLINNIPVPVSFYTVVYAFRSAACIGFILPNADVKAEALWDHAMSVQQVEAKTKLTFFDKLGDRADPIKRALSVEFWQQAARAPKP